MIAKTLLFSVCAFAVSVTAHADVTVLNDVVDSNGVRNTMAFGSFGTQIGQEFTTGGTTLNLSNVVFSQVAPSPTTNLDGYRSGETFGLYANNPLNNMPVLATPIYLFTLTDNTIPGTGFSNPNTTFGVITATAPTGAANVALVSGLSYWLVLSYSSDVYWNISTSNSYSSQLGVTIPDTGSNFSTDSNGTAYYDLADGPQLVTINAVPEPSTYCLLGLAGAAAFVMVRRTRSAKAA